MKTKIFFSIVVTIMFVISASGQIKVTSSNVTTIGKPAAEVLTIDYTGYSGGGLAIYPSNSAVALLGKPNHTFLDIFSYNVLQVSDVRLKENIRSINNALNLVKQLNGVKYDYKVKAFLSDTLSKKVSSQEMNIINKHRKNYLGFLAQDVQKILPEVVSHDDSTDIYAIDYIKFIPILVEAIKEQQNIIDAQNAKIKELDVRLSALEGNSGKKTGVIGTEAAEIMGSSSLEQNTPNPFSKSTTVAYHLSESVNNATIYVYDMNGVQIKSYPIASKGNGSITINGYELRPGMYLYTLIADGHEVATKRMILTQ